MTVVTESADRRLIAIFMVVLIDVLGITIMFPLLPFYSEHFGASAQVVGLLVSSYAFCQLISGPILGHWSDKIGRKPVLIVSQIGTFIGFLILASARSLVWIFIARIIDGLTAGNISTAQAYISDVSSPQNRAKALGKIGVAFSIGFFIGPALTAFLYHYGYQAPIYAAAFLSFMSIMASTFLLPSHVRPAGTPSAKGASATGEEFSFANAFKYLKNPVIAVLLLEVFLFYFAFSAYMSGFALFAERRFTFNGQPLTPKQVGYAFTYFGFLGILIQGFLMGRLVNKFGERKLGMIGFISSFVGYGLLAFIHQPLMILVTGLFTSFGGGVLRPVLISEIAGAVPPQERGRVIGVNQSLQSIAQIISPIVSTALIGGAFIAQWAFFPAVISGVGALLVLAQARKASRDFQVQ